MPCARQVAAASSFTKTGLFAPFSAMPKRLLPSNCQSTGSQCLYPTSTSTVYCLPSWAPTAQAATLRTFRPTRPQFSMWFRARSGADCRLGNRCGLQKDWTIRGVSIPNKISRGVVPRERLGDLARDPFRGWVCRHAKRHPKPSSVAHNDKTIQNLEGDRRQDKEVDRRDAVDVIAEKRPPALRRWPRMAAHVPSDRRLGDLEAELEQLTVNTRRAPQCVRTAHLANERAQLSRDHRSANTVAGSPAPIHPKPGTVPANDGLRPDDRNHLKDGRKPAREPNK